MSEIHAKFPWPKVQFRTGDGLARDGYLYYILGDAFYLSEIQYGETREMVQGWIINWHNIIKFYNEKYGLKCTCGAAEAGSACHTCACKWQTINTDLI
jgi:hypothetical protein